MVTPELVSASIDEESSVLSNMTGETGRVFEFDQQHLDLALTKLDSFCPVYVKNVLGTKLHSIIFSIVTNPITDQAIKNIIKDNFNMKLFQTKKEKAFLFNVESILKATLIYYISLKKPFVPDEFTTEEELLDEYSEYTIFNSGNMDSTEIEFLLAFRNTMKLALQIIPAKRNKMLLVSVCALLEGSGRTYVAGGDQSAATCRRFQIYEHESGRKKGFPTKEKEKPIVACVCGAVILRRTMWRHNRSSKHILFCEEVGLKEKSIHDWSKSATSTVRFVGVSLPPISEAPAVPPLIIAHPSDISLLLHRPGRNMPLFPVK